MSRATKIRGQLNPLQNHQTKTSIPTTNSITGSNNTERRKKRGFTLCKNLATNFDRIYTQRDLIVQTSKPQQNDGLTQNEQLRTSRSSSKNKFLSSLKSVKSEKLLLNCQNSSNCGSRIRIGRSRSRSRQGKQQHIKQQEQAYDTNSFNCPSSQSQYTFKNNNGVMHLNKNYFEGKNMREQSNKDSKNQKKYARISEYGIIRRR